MKFIFVLFSFVAQLYAGDPAPSPGPVRVEGFRCLEEAACLCRGWLRSPSTIVAGATFSNLRRAQEYIVIDNEYVEAASLLLLGRLEQREFLSAGDADEAQAVAPYLAQRLRPSPFGKKLRRILRKADLNTALDELEIWGTYARHLKDRALVPELKNLRAQIERITPNPNSAGTMSIRNLLSVGWLNEAAVPTINGLGKVARARGSKLVLLVPRLRVQSLRDWLDSQAPDLKVQP